MTRWFAVGMMLTQGYQSSFIRIVGWQLFWVTPFGHFVLAILFLVKLSSDDRCQILRDVSNELFDTQNSYRFTMWWWIPWRLGNLRRSIKNDTFIYIVLCISNFTHCKLHFRPLHYTPKLKWSHNTWLSPDQAISNKWKWYVFPLCITGTHYVWRQYIFKMDSTAIIM